MKINRLFILTFSISLGLSCMSNKHNNFKIQSTYTANKNSNEFRVQFIKKSDTLFMLYYFFYENGNYINAPDDSSDYAGFFLEKGIKNNGIIFTVKNYREYWRDSTRVFSLNLNFLSDSTFNWFIDSSKFGIFDYLPNEITFTSKK